MSILLEGSEDGPAFDKDFVANMPYYSELKAHFDFQTLFSSSLNVTLMPTRDAILMTTNFGEK